MEIEQTDSWKLAQLKDMQNRAKRERRTNIIATTAATISICLAALTVALFVIVDHVRNSAWYIDDEQWNEEIMERLERIETQLSVQEAYLILRKEDGTRDSD